MYELTVMLAVFLTVALSCWWIGDGEEAYPTIEPTAAPLRQTPRLRIQEQGGLGD